MHDNSAILFIVSLIPPEGYLKDNKHICIKFNNETENYIYTNITKKYEVNVNVKV